MSACLYTQRNWRIDAGQCIINDAVLLQVLQQLAQVPTVALELQPGAAHSFDRGFEAVASLLASQHEGHMPWPAQAAAIIRTVMSEADGVRTALKFVARQCGRSSKSPSAAGPPTAGQVAAAEEAAAALLQVTVPKRTARTLPSLCDSRASKPGVKIVLRACFARSIAGAPSEACTIM